MTTAAAVIAAVVVASALPASASTTWAAALAANSKGEGQSYNIPLAPSSISASCDGLVGNQIDVSWSAVTADKSGSTYRSGVVSYDIYMSSTSSSSGFSSQATGVTATSWKSARLGLGTYYFRVAADAGTTVWEGAQSASSPAHSVIIGLICT